MTKIRTVRKYPRDVKVGERIAIDTGFRETKRKTVITLTRLVKGQSYKIEGRDDNGERYHWQQAAHRKLDVVL